MFNQRAVQAEHLLIAGYGFGDEIVNRTLTRVAARAPSPRILVITYGDNPTDEVVNSVLGHTEAGPKATACRHGIPDAMSCEHWQTWSVLNP